MVRRDGVSRSWRLSGVDAGFDRKSRLEGWKPGR
jgi:hypothetical protein